MHGSLGGGPDMLFRLERNFWMISMLFTDLVTPSRVAVNVTAAEPRGLFDRAAALIGGQCGVAPRLIQRVLAEREAAGSTGFGGGVAIPHGRVAGMPGMAGAVLRLARPVEWQAVDSQPVGLAVVLVGPDDAGVDHLKALAMVSRMVRNRGLVARMMGAANAEALWALMAGPIEAEAA